MPSLLSCIACALLAQAGAAPAGQAANTPPAVPVTERWVSPFADYRRFDDAPLKPWRAANDEVRDAGGHIGLMKGLSAPAAATAAGKSPAGGAAGAPAPAKRAGSSAKDAEPHQHHRGHQ
jgi:hypothetical protein